MSVLNPKLMESVLSDAFDDGQNVIIEGAHGVGKTEIIRSVFGKKLKDNEWLHFSCASIDPFIDFMGCPIKSEEDGIEFLKMIKPEKFAKGNIKAIFLDEFNRAPRNVKNAVMELLQFKTMNGDKIGDIKVIWTAINPPDGDYDVDIIEPAQMDRFHLHLKIDGRPNKKYFVDKFGKAKGNGAITWWNKLDAKQKTLISPRRLDYIMEHLNRGRNPEYCCMDKLPFGDLTACITQIPIKEKLDELKTDDEKFNFFKNSDNRLAAKSFVMSDDNFKDWVYYYPAEHIVTMLTEANKEQVGAVQTKLFMECSAFKGGSKDYKPIHHFHNAIKPALQSKQNKTLVEQLESWELVYESLGQL